MGNKNDRYIPGIAQLKFKPNYDWEANKAKQMYIDAKHLTKKIDEIVYEDCISGMQKLPDTSIDLIIADPPFGIEFVGMESMYNRNSDFVVEGYTEIKEDYDQFTLNWIAELPRIMKDTSSVYIFSGWTNLNDVLTALKQANLEVINHIIWKYQFGVYTKRKFVTSHYHILFAVKNKKKYFFNKFENYPLDVWDIPRTYMPGQKKNITKLPENVVIRIINFSSKPGDLVFDPFMGNATTAVCAKLTYRHYYGFEINLKMKDVIDENIKNVKLGDAYKPYHTFLPSLETLIEKYPNIKSFLQDEENLTQISSFYRDQFLKLKSQKKSISDFF